MADVAAKLPPFLKETGKPAIPWSEWHSAFETCLIAAGCEKFTPRCRAAILKTYLGEAGSRITYFTESTRPVSGDASVNDYDYLAQGVATHTSPSQRPNRIDFQSLRQQEAELAV